MKKIFTIILFVLISMNISFAAEDFILQNGVKYISASKSEEIWGVNIDHYPRSGLVKIENDKTVYYGRWYSNKLAKNIYINPFFLDSKGIVFNGDIELEGAIYLINGEIYIPVQFFYKELYKDDLYDVVVVGGDPEGVTAAVSAARNGGKTLLLSSEDGLGGLFTYGMLNTLDMNYNKKGELLTRGIFDEFYDKIGRTESFSVDEVKKIFEDMVLNESNIDYRKNYSVADVVLENNVITGVVMKDANSKMHTFYGKRIIDATQDGDVCALANVPFHIGMEDVNIPGKMAATLVFKVGGVDWKELSRDIERYKRETKDYSCGINESSAWGFGKWCYKNYQSVYDNMKFRGPNIGLQNDGTVLINALQIFGVDPLNSESVENAKKMGKIEAQNALQHLKNKLNSFKNAYFIDVADELYIRESRHIEGEYTLQASDLLEGVNFQDKIAMGSYPLDIQSTDMKNNGFVVFAPDQYSIPYRCIVPKEIDNLFIVGKSASYSSVAAGSARVVPIGMVEGQSAGAIAMYTIANNIKPRDIINNFQYMPQITSLLKGQGVYLPDYEPSEPYNNLIGYENISQLIDYGVLTGGYKNDFRFDENATEIRSTNILRSYVVRKLNFDKDILKERLQYFISDEEITTVSLIRIIYSLGNKDYNTISDMELWNYAIDNGYLKNILGIGMNDIVTMKDMYIIIVNGVENIANNL